MDIKIKKLILLLSIVFSLPVFCQIRLPKFVSNNMVLQRNAPVKIWGWALKRGKVSVHFLGSTYNTLADNKGDWIIQLPKLKAGGPYTMQITGSNSITIHNIMIGDVWLCSGQSNMEHTMGSFYWVYKKVIASSTNKNIREFNVPETYNFIAPQKDFKSGNWQEANPKNVFNWSAVAYFFGKYIYAKYKVPIGLINSSLGGTPIECWLSASALKKFPQDYNEALMFRDITLIKKIETADRARRSTWYKLSWDKDRGYKNPNNIWTKPSLNTSGWSTMKVPGYWANTKLGMVNGVIWFRKKVNIPSSMVGKPAKIILGRIVDADSTFINGKFVGTTSYLYPRRRYHIPEGILKAGENTVVIRVISNIGSGGFVLDKPYEITAGGKSVSLKGKWKFCLGVQMPPLRGPIYRRWKQPEGLYNAMIAPMLNMRIKGVVWYQGEANANNPIEYGKLFRALIRSWREKWHEGNFPFLFVQLPNFMVPIKEPSESNWALVRESQLDALSLPNTGMAVTIDIGEWNDLHPVDKKDVGKRLALAAEKIAYRDNIFYSGPIYKSMKVEGNKAVISFTHTGTGLMVKNGSEPGCFSIAGKDRHFIWAKAKIVRGTPSGEDNKVVVWDKKIPHPAAVRYAWADSPVGPKLYNKESLPASPFRTDDWPAKQRH